MEQFQGWIWAAVAAFATGFVAPAAVAGSTLGAAAWSNPRVEVCFASKRQTGLSRFGDDAKTFPSPAKVTDSTAEERALIESAIRAEYRAAETGIEFTGFQPCISGGTAKVYIYVGKGGPLGAANIGERMKIEKFWTYTDRSTGRAVVSPVYLKLDSALPSYVFFQNLMTLREHVGILSPADRLRLNAIHEFGHTAGLLHEDERVETDASPNCRYLNSRSAYRVSEPTILTAYDPASIMSYCFINLILESTGTHYQVARPGNDARTLPREGLPLVAAPGLYFEESTRLLERSEKPDRFEYRIRLGLSAKDQRSLRCIYSAERCTPSEQ